MFYLKYVVKFIYGVFFHWALQSSFCLTDLAALYGSKPDIVKEVYSSLLKISAEFARNDLNKDTVSRFLIDECKYSKNRAEDFAIVYDKHKLKLQVILGNIGMHLPHITDVNWKIDYVVQVSTLFGHVFYCYKSVIYFSRAAFCSRKDLCLELDLSPKCSIKNHREIRDKR